MKINQYKQSKLKLSTKTSKTVGSVTILSLIALAVGFSTLLPSHQSRADGWTIDNIQGDMITSANNPGGYPNNTPSQSPDNGTNFSPAFGTDQTSPSTITINGSNFPTSDFNIDAKEVQHSLWTGCYLSNAPDSWLYCWGTSELIGGIGSTASPVRVPRGQISDNEVITDFSLGSVVNSNYNYMCAITDLNKTYCWGYTGEWLGIGVSLGSAGIHNTPELIQQGDLPDGAYFQTIKAGYQNTCAVSNEDKVYCWGFNQYGEVGHDSIPRYPIPKKVKTVSDGSSYVMPETIKQIDVGRNHTCAIAADDKVYCWGRNNQGQLGDNTTTDRLAPVRVYSDVSFRQVSIGYESSCALSQSGGQIHCWGSNNYGQLGNGTTNNSSVPIVTDSSVVFDKLGAISGESYGYCAISEVSAAYCWGGEYVGDGTTASAKIPTPVKTASNGGIMPDSVISITRDNYSYYNNYTCAVADNYKVYCWGISSNNKSSLGNNANILSSTTPVQVVQFTDLPIIQFDDTFGTYCNQIIVVSSSQLKCTVSTLGDGLHDILITYGSETQVLPQSYMYRRTPNAPTNVTAVGKNQMVHLAWDWLDDKPYFIDIHFSFRCKRSDATTWNLLTTHNCDGSMGSNVGGYPISTRETNIFGLQNGVSYDFMVIPSFGFDGASIYNITPQASSYVPSKPTITNSTASSTTATISWSAPSSDGGSPILGYMLMNKCASYYTNGDFVQSRLDSYPASATSASSDSYCLNSSNPAQFSVIAFNANGASEPSEVVEVWGTAALKAPGIPSNIKVNNVNNDQTMLSWSAPSNNGSAITSYEVRYSTLSDFSDWTDNTTNTCITNTPSPPTTSCVTDSLSLGVQYYFQVRALNANGASDWSIIHATVVGAPDRPVISTVTPNTIDSTTSSIYLAWNTPGDNGAAITGYTVEYSTDPAFDPSATTSVNTGTTTNYTLDPATNGTIYYFRVSATNSRGTSPWSDPVQAIPYAPPTIISIAPDHGLVTGGQLVTITGTNFNGTSAVTIGGIDCTTFAVIDSQTINCLTPANSAVGAKDVSVTNLGGTDTLVGGFTYGIPSISLSIDHDISLEVTNPGSGTVSTSHNTTVKTNNPTGYKLSLSMEGNNQNLESNGASLRPTDASVTATALPINTWGHSVIDANNHWTSVPIVSSPKLIKNFTTTTIDGMDGTGDQTQIFYGINVDLTQRAGSYSARVVYTAVAEY